MVVYEDECVGCGLPCIGRSCKYMNVPHIYCDKCGEEIYDTDVSLTAHIHYCEKCNPDRWADDEEEEYEDVME